ncbi:glycosyltransferase family 2 protein [Oscillatoria sp. FACHB-1406]|nr:glycosyltransferase family 2 protein [Oscillatoria sp. FACHB-1406]
MQSPPEKLPVSVLIPAKNEELNLPACLQSVARAAEVFVVDSNSSDRSAEISLEYGARVVQFDFEAEKERYDAAMTAYNEKIAHLQQIGCEIPADIEVPHLRKKKNWSLDTLPFSYKWVLIVDCDERITPDLWSDIEAVLQQPNSEGYYIARRVYFLGRWLRYGGKYPDLNLRLFKHQRGRYEDLGLGYIPNTGDNEVHEHVVLRDEVGNKLSPAVLAHPMDHIDFRNIHQWLDRHNRYSNWEAAFYNKLLNGELNDDIKPSLLIKGPQRTRFLRIVWARLPFKPLLRFILVYILRLGFLDGRAGYIYARLIAQYEYHIGVKLYELRHFSGSINGTIQSPAEKPLVSIRKAANR